jgi:hypothetical protein
LDKYIVTDDTDITLAWLVEQGGYIVTEENGEKMYRPVPDVLQRIAPEVWANHLMHIHQEMLDLADAGHLTVEWDDEAMDFVVDFPKAD